MKKIFIILFVVLLAGCLFEDDSNNTVKTKDDHIPTIPEGPTSNDLLVGVIFTIDSIDFYYGDYKVNKFNKKGFKIAENKICVENYIYTYDQYGNLTDTFELSHNADAGIIVNGNIYTCKNITPEESQSLGAMYKYHVQYYYNNAEYGSFWATNQYKVIEMLCTENGTIASRDLNLSLHDVTGSESIIYADNNGAEIISDGSLTNMFEYLNGNLVEFSMNYFKYIKSMIKCGSTYYSNNGYTFDSSLHENVNCLWDYVDAPENAYRPNFVAVRNESGHDRIYYIELSTGWLYKFTPDFNTRVQVVRLYLADGEASTGALYETTINTNQIDGALYYNLENTIYKYVFDENISYIIDSGYGECKGL